MSEFLIKLNHIGIPVEPSEIDAILASSSDIPLSPELKWQCKVLESFFALPVRHLPKEILERYIEASKKEIYIPISLSSGKLFERLFSPLKSAKRCYCFGEYIAVIEMCAHIGEMLAILLWQISPIKFNGSLITKDIEKKLWGRKFENLGQEKRIELLEVFGTASKSHIQIFKFLKDIRPKYFHLWSSSVENAKSDALECFTKASILIKEILQIEISSQDPGKLTMNPLLVEYLSKNHEELLGDIS